MKSSSGKKGMFLFVYILVGLVLSGILTISLYGRCSDCFVSMRGILVVGIVVASLLGFFISKASNMILKVIGYLISIVAFSIFVLVFFPIFASGDLLDAYKIFYGAAIAGELILFAGTAIVRGKRFYMGIISLLCIVVYVMIFGMSMDSGVKAVISMIVMLAYLFISTIFYYDSENEDYMEMLERSGMIFNVVAFFISMYGRYTGSWKR